MAKTVMSVKDALKSMEGKTNEKGEIVLNRFNKKNFNTLLLALANDVEFTSKVAKKTKEGTAEVEEVLVSKSFRKWCKSLVEAAGVDSKEAERVMDSSFVVPNVEGLYDFFTAAMYEYMAAGNRFDFPTREDFSASLSIKDIEATSKTNVAKNPQTKEVLGTFEIKKKKHKEMKVKSNCPSWLVERVKQK